MIALLSYKLYYEVQWQESGKQPLSLFNFYSRQLLILYRNALPKFSFF